MLAEDQGSQRRAERQGGRAQQRQQRHQDIPKNRGAMTLHQGGRAQQRQQRHQDIPKNRGAMTLHQGGRAQQRQQVLAEGRGSQRRAERQGVGVSVPWPALVPLGSLALVFDVWCLGDSRRGPPAQYLACRLPLVAPRTGPSRQALQALPASVPRIPDQRLSQPEALLQVQPA